MNRNYFVTFDAAAEQKKCDAVTAGTGTGLVFMGYLPIFKTENKRMKKTATRRNFLRYSALGLGGLAIGAPGEKKPLTNMLAVPGHLIKPLKIVCAGAHPGDPEFGCGGTMAKYSAAGHKIIFLYLTRGEAYDKNKTAAEAAGIRTKEAETACAGLHVTPRFAGQIDGDTILNARQNDVLFNIIEAEKPDIVFTQWPWIRIVITRLPVYCY